MLLLTKRLISKLSIICTSTITIFLIDYLITILLKKGLIIINLLFLTIFLSISRTESRTLFFALNS